jgi:hypothetical protein
VEIHLTAKGELIIEKLALIHRAELLGHNFASLRDSFKA